MLHADITEKINLFTKLGTCKVESHSSGQSENFALLVYCYDSPRDYMKTENLKTFSLNVQFHSRLWLQPNLKFRVSCPQAGSR